MSPVVSLEREYRCVLCGACQTKPKLPRGWFFYGDRAYACRRCGKACEQRGEQFVGNGRASRRSSGVSPGD